MWLTRRSQDQVSDRAVAALLRRQPDLTEEQARHNLEGLRALALPKDKKWSRLLNTSDLGEGQAHVSFGSDRMGGGGWPS